LDGLGKLETMIHLLWILPSFAIAGALVMLIPALSPHRDERKPPRDNWQKSSSWFTIGVSQRESAGFKDLKGYVNF
jgi:hypothetical protein